MPRRHPRPALASLARLARFPRGVLAAALLAAACGSSAAPGAGATPDGAPANDASDAGTTAAPGLAAAVSSLSPPPASGGTCPDTPLRIGFKSAPTLGSAGKIQIWQAGKTDAPVDVIDLAAPMFEDTIAGRHFFKNLPVVVEGTDAIILPHVGRLAGGHDYFVTVEPGVFADADKHPLGGLTDPSAWTFTTRVPTPVSPGALTVAADGSGDFCTVQGAVDAIPAGNTTPVTVTIQAGTYREIVLVAGKNEITFHGADRARTVIAYANNETLQRALGTRFRALFNIESDGVIVENLTVQNTTPTGGSQSEAVRVEPGDRVILRDANFLGQQDTLLLTGRVYVARSTIAGNVDFVWGKGAAYFDRCELRTVARKGYGVQSRSAMGGYGFVFVDSQLTAEPGLSGHFLARIDITAFPYSQVAFIGCRMGSHISPLGWSIGGGLPTTDVTTLRFGEYQSTDLAGAPLDVSGRTPLAKQLSDADAATLRDKTIVLGGWNPTP